MGWSPVEVWDLRCQVLAKQRIDKAEHRGIGPNAQRQSQHHRRPKAGLFSSIRKPWRRSFNIVVSGWWSIKLLISDGWCRLRSPSSVLDVRHLSPDYETSHLAPEYLPSTHSLIWSQRSHLWMIIWLLSKDSVPIRILANRACLSNEQSYQNVLKILP